MNRIQLLMAIGCTVAGLAQTPKLTFDAASIKPSASDGFAMRTMIGGGPGGRFSAQGLTARALILQAYGMQDYQVSGGPGWITSDRFDIEATPGAGVAPSPAASQQMLQTLLEERFQLKVRQETKSMPGFTLTAAKGGPKLKKSSSETGREMPPPGGEVPRAGESGVFITRGVGPQGAGPASGGMMRMGPGSLSLQGMTMEIFSRMLSNQLGRPITDQTGLTEAYDIELQWTPDRAPLAISLPAGIQMTPVDPGGPDIFAAIQEQLGLRLEANTQLGQALIIERIEKPSEN